MERTKNWDPFVFGPELAIARIPAPVKRRAGWISCRAPTAGWFGQVSTVGRGEDKQGYGEGRTSANLSP